MKGSILHTEASTGWGGQEIRIVQESLGMRGRGYRVVIAAPEHSLIYTKAREAGLEAVPALFQKKNPASFYRMAAFIRRGKFQVVNTHSSADSWVASIAAKLSGIRPALIRTRHLSTPIGRSLLSAFIYDILPDAVMTTGEEIRRMMVEHNGFRASKILSVPTGVDLQRFTPVPPQASPKKEAFSVGMVGVLRSWKGHQYFLEAVPEILREIPDARFYIAGDGPQRENIENTLRARSLESRVTLLGHREDIPDIMASLDVLVHPSYASEGVPQTLLQALAMKKAVVASDTGAIKEIIHNGITGYLIEPRRPDILASKVIDLYLHPETREKFGDAGRRLVERDYSFDGMLDRIESLYRTILEKSGG